MITNGNYSECFRFDRLALAIIAALYGKSQTGKDEVLWIVTACFTDGLGLCSHHFQADIHR
jgi:hypothetical protein